MITPRTTLRGRRRRIAAILLALAAALASAQTQHPSLDLRLRPLPEATDGSLAVPDQQAVDTATSVHGSFTTGIGVSKNYGNSTVNAAELDVTRQYENGRALDLHIGVLHSTGLPAAAPRDYVSRYPGD